MLPFSFFVICMANLLSVNLANNLGIVALVRESYKALRGIRLNALVIGIL